ncbi:MAG: hemolysin family protein [Paracoccaceae bacterium]|jgi:magnesium and cobalt transporter
MGDTKDGSSIAAHRAQTDLSFSTPQGGFWKKLFRQTPDDTLNNHDEPNAAEISAAGANSMLLNIRNMHDMRVDDVAIPTADIASVPDDATLEEVVAAFRDSTNSRLPVYSETLDNPLGLVHLKDIALNYGFGGSARFDLKSILRPLIYVPPSMHLGALLQKMQSERLHMALVIDEYGGVEGLVTLEDLIEEIVGEIEDEHDAEDEQLWTEESASVFVAQARAPLDEFEDAAGVDLLPDDLDEEVDTLGGLVFMLIGRVPSRGECIRDGHGHEFEVIDADARRVKTLRVRLNVKGPLGQAAE